MVTVLSRHPTGNILPATSAVEWSLACKLLAATPTVQGLLWMQLEDPRSNWTIQTTENQGVNLYTSSNHSSKKMIPPIFVSFHWGWFFTSMIMGESVKISKPASWHRWSPAWASHHVSVLCPPQVHTLPWKKKRSSRCWLINTHSISYIFQYPKIHNYGQTWIWWHGQILVKPRYTLLFFGQKKKSLRRIRQVALMGRYPPVAAPWWFRFLTFQPPHHLPPWTKQPTNSQTDKRTLKMFGKCPSHFDKNIPPWHLDKDLNLQSKVSNIPSDDSISEIIDILRVALKWLKQNESEPMHGKTPLIIK